MADLAIIGAGIMGANHARIAATHPRVNLVAVCDPELERAEALARSHGAIALSSIDALPRSIEAAIVATPTATHEEAAIELIRRGVHVLVEKPLAPTVAAGNAIVKAAEAAGVVLAVGHVERFNPAVLQLPQLLGQIVHIDSARISPYSKRISDGVVLDLMIHDLDIALALCGESVRSVQAMSRQLHSGSEDLASVFLHFESGPTATVTASRIGQNKIRRMEITQVDTFVTVDLIRQDIQINRVVREEFISGEGARYRQQGVVEIPFVDARGEPLFLQLDDFIAAIAGGRGPRVDGRAGLVTLELCHRVLETLD